MLWRPELIPIALTVDAAPEGFVEAKSIDPTAFATVLAERLVTDGRHVVIEDAQGEHRLWLRDTTPGRRLAVLVPLDRDFSTRVASLARFHRRLLGRRPGPPPRGWVLTPYRRNRLVLMLRALDLRLAGASYREIAVALGNIGAAHLSATEWKGSSERSYVVRLGRDQDDERRLPHPAPRTLIDVLSQGLMVHYPPSNGRMRYGPGTPRERHND